MYLTISGAYGRDYANKKAILADWVADKDFVIRTFGPDDGRHINKADARRGGIRAINVRYAKDRKIAVLKRNVEGDWKVN